MEEEEDGEMGREKNRPIMSEYDGGTFFVVVVVVFVTAGLTFVSQRVTLQ